MRLLKIVTAAVFMLGVTWVLFQGLGHDPRALPSPLIGKPLPAFELVAIDGSQVSSAQLRGRPTIINSWASWCPECVAEYSVLLAAQRRYGPRVAIVGVLYQDQASNALAFLARYGDGGWRNLVDDGGRLAIDFGVTGPPESYFIDAEGIVRFKQFGAVTAAVIDDELVPLLPAGK
ncbi:MAG: DsbE family thiol:disulfide interchange protein [Chloroflexi bacterium]|nr:DsbE family thiol:disulfide interchange protein [Chloroflexota bacterium]